MASFERITGHGLAEGEAAVVRRGGLVEPERRAKTLAEQLDEETVLEDAARRDERSR
jgi:hypothetical protein